MRGVGSTYFKSVASRIKKFEIKFYLDLSIKTLFSVFMSCKECFIAHVSKYSDFDFKCFKTFEFQIQMFEKYKF